jgi:predicted RNA-binding Zn-ribbon protein involved in translation (DUF1610 family)
MNTCPHDGFHKTDADLAACLRTRLEAALAVKVNTALNPCPNCGAMIDCCAASRARGQTADTLANLTDRQSQKITELTREIEKKNQVAEALRARIASLTKAPE